MQLPGHQVGDRLGDVPGGESFAARRLLDGAAVVVEVLRLPDPFARVRLLSAADDLRRCDGRGLVRVREVVGAPEHGLDADVVVVVRDLVDGAPVAAASVEQAVLVVADVLDALAVLHAAGLVHGGLTAACIVRDGSVPVRPTVRLTGWGTAPLVTGRAVSPPDDVRAAVALLRGLLPGPAPAALEAVLAAGEGTSAAELSRRLRSVPRGPVARTGRSRATAVPAPVAPVARVPVDAAAPVVAAVPEAAAAVPDEPQPEPEPQSQPARDTGPPPAGPAPVPSAADPSASQRRGPRGRRALAIAGAAAVLLPAAALAAVLLADEPAPEAGPRLPGPYVFAPLARPDGLVVERRWVLEEAGAVLRATTVVRNSTGAPVSGAVDEVVPKSVADDVDDLDLVPTPDEVVERDPVVRYRITDLAGYGRTSWEYVVTLPSPVASLTELAGEADRARLQHEVRLRTQPTASPSPG